MLIESIIRRPGGTKTKIGRIEYHFKPQADDGPHVAEVADKDHAALLLAIREGYRLPGEAPVVDEELPVLPEEDPYPLAEIVADQLSNRELQALAKAHMGLVGSNKQKALDFAKANLGADLSTELPLASYMDIVREILRRMAAVEKRMKLDDMQADLKGE